MTATETGGELQDAKSYYQAIKPTMERKNTIGLCIDDQPAMRACRKKVRLSCIVIVYAVIRLLLILLYLL